uniref:Uncharacterized protein n=1 Tax=Arundo donax TaxID=35708 RepID=A0A0A8ZY69_ARUDO
MQSVSVPFLVTWYHGITICKSYAALVK